MGRRLFTILAAVSLVMCVAAVALRVRAIWYIDSVGRADYREGELYFSSYDGLLKMARTDEIRHSPLGWRADHLPNRPGQYYSRNDSWLKRMGFEFESWSGQEMRESGKKINPLIFHHTYGSIPLWFIAGLFAIAPAIWLRPYFRRRPRLAGHCNRCGYNLAGNVSGVCPECGTDIASGQPQQVEE